jgi:hypothetical protein
VAIKQRSCFLEVLCGVGFGGGDAPKRFVEQSDDPLLLRMGRMTDMKRLHLWEIDCLMNRTTRESEKIISFRDEEILQEGWSKLRRAHPIHKVLTGRHWSTHHDDVTN